MESDLMKSAKRYMDKNSKIKCRICGKDVYTYHDFECTKRGGKYIFIHKECIEKR